MKKSKRLLPVQKVNEMREKDAAKIVGQVRQLVADEEAKLESLVSYRGDYQLSIKVGSSPSGQQLQDFHGFLINLNIAIDQQEARVKEVRAELETKIIDWEKAHGKLKVMDRLITRFEKEEQLFEGKQEQKFIDDLPKRPQFRI